MPHRSKIKDTETHFIIDPETRTIKNTSAGNNIIVQYDHNSERFTFEIPRYVDGHDMFECKTSGEVRVNYINSASNGFSKMLGRYSCDDLQISEDDEDVVTFSWLLSSDATQYIGYLYFSIQFICYEGGKPSYSWNTGVYKDVVIIESININEENGKEYADFLQTWKDDLDASKIVSLVQTTFSTEAGGVNEITATFGDGHTEVFQLKNGEPGVKGDTGLVGSIETINDGRPLHFFVGTQEEYNSLPEEVKLSGLYAIITDGVVEPLVYLAYVGGRYGNILCVNAPNLVLREGVEMMVKVPVSNSLDTSEPISKIDVNGTGESFIQTSDPTFGTMECNAWNAGEILIFKKKSDGWALVENLTQHKIYPCDWKPFDISDNCFEEGKTYQVTVEWINHRRVYFSFFTPPRFLGEGNSLVTRVYSEEYYAENPPETVNHSDYIDVFSSLNGGKFKLAFYRNEGTGSTEFTQNGEITNCYYRIVR